MCGNVILRRLRTREGGAWLQCVAFLMLASGYPELLILELFVVCEVKFLNLTCLLLMLTLGSLILLLELLTAHLRRGTATSTQLFGLRDARGALYC